MGIETESKASAHFLILAISSEFRFLDGTFRNAKAPRTHFLMALMLSQRFLICFHSVYRYSSRTGLWKIFLSGTILHEFPLNDSNQVDCELTGKRLHFQFSFPENRLTPTRVFTQTSNPVPCFYTILLLLLSSALAALRTEKYFILIFRYSRGLPRKHHVHNIFMLLPPLLLPTIHLNSTTISISPSSGISGRARSSVLTDSAFLSVCKQRSHK